MVGEYIKNDITRLIMFEIRFIHTFAFMAAPVESLARNLKVNCNNINDVRNVFKNSSNEY
jgi:hypothetical protein